MREVEGLVEGEAHPGEGGIIEQRSPEWFRQREGKLTASQFGNAIGIIGSRAELWRNITGRGKRWINEAAVKWGTTLEPIAIADYEQDRPFVVGREGFCLHPEIEWIGGSPDGILFDPPRFKPRGNGLLEAKCPFSQELWEEPKDYYMPQVQGLMEIRDLDWCEFLCWTPFGKRIWFIERSKEYWEWMLPKLSEFWSYVEFDIEPPAFGRGKRYRYNGTLKIERIQ
jgi:putative phage-type endonuclease